ncbi:hypothetical protein OIU84_015261 [Salix udensis]|uniref:Cytokinin riboside 5'-monophosphate phosphoribohydrolase n=1 Tax=Salix udensis TaxID=889485 RepID=A0AAD6JEW2_9ROSI|nr:hypothetical protein OIU84_015261 [Salix udensis]
MLQPILKVCQACAVLVLVGLRQRGYFFIRAVFFSFLREKQRERKMEIEMKHSKFKRICVFCGSSPGKKSSYKDAAIELAKELVSRNIDLVYGGGSIGLMGLISQAVFNGGRHVIGVIPKTLMPREITGETVGEVKAVADMHQRKAEMARNSDAFIALPGGYGTLEELLEVITWAQLGIHDKPVKHYLSLVSNHSLLLVSSFNNPYLQYPLSLSSSSSSKQRVTAGVAFCRWDC